MAALKCFNGPYTVGWNRCLFCQGGRFLDTGIKSEFQRTDCANSGNLTDFTTRCTWVLQSPIIACPRVKTKNDRKEKCRLLWRPFVDDVDKTISSTPLNSSTSTLSLPSCVSCVRKPTANKPFHCDHVGCGKSFARNEELTRHKRIHSGERPHQCEICLMRFGRKDHLTKHRKTHIKASERRNYICDVGTCDKSFTRSDALTRHQSKIHKIKKTLTRLSNFPM